MPERCLLLIQKVPRGDADNFLRQQDDGKDYVAAIKDAGLELEGIEYADELRRKLIGMMHEMDFVVAEMTDDPESQRIEVLHYLIGLRHGIGKPMILLARSTAHLPLALQQRPTIRYVERGFVDFSESFSKEVQRLRGGEDEQPGNPVYAYRYEHELKDQLNMLETRLNEKQEAQVPIRFLPVRRRR